MAGDMVRYRKTVGYVCRFCGKEQKTMLYHYLIKVGCCSMNTLIVAINHRIGAFTRLGAFINHVKGAFRK